jgi:hypothetical protein
MKSETRFWRVFALPATVVIALTMLAVALVLLGGVALAAPPQQEPVCDIDVEGKTLDEVRAELEACAAQLGGVGAQAMTELTVEKWANPGVFTGPKAVTFTVSVQGGSGYFSLVDDVSHLGNEFISAPTVVVGSGQVVTTTDNKVVGFGLSTPFECRWVMTLTTPTGWTTNTVEVEDVLTDETAETTVGLAGLDVDITKTATDFVPGQYISYTITIANNDTVTVCVIMADNVGVGNLGWLWGEGTYGYNKGTAWVGPPGATAGTYDPDSECVIEPPGSATFGTFSRKGILYWEMCIGPDDSATMTIVPLVSGGQTEPITNTAEFWVWDKAWEATDEGHGYQKIEVVSQPPRGIFLPIILKAYTFP